MFLIRWKIAGDGFSRASSKFPREETVFEVPGSVVNNSESFDSDLTVVMVQDLV